MTAASDEQLIRTERWQYRQFTLKAGQIAYKGASACLNTADGKCYPAAGALATLLTLGVFAETVDASAAGPLGSVDQPVNVDLLRQKTVLWRANDGTIAAANVGSACYYLDDSTVTLTATAHSKAGTILAVDSVLGVAFEVEGL